MPERHWFGDKRTRPGCVGAGDICFQCARGEHHHRDSLQSLIGFDLGEYFESVLARHVHIKQDQFRQGSVAPAEMMGRLVEHWVYFGANAPDPLKITTFQTLRKAYIQWRKQ